MPLLIALNCCRGKVFLKLNNLFRFYVQLASRNLTQSGKHLGIKFRPYRSPPPCAFNNFKQSLQIMKTLNGADGGIIYKYIYIYINES